MKRVPDARLGTFVRIGARNCLRGILVGAPAAAATLILLARFPPGEPASIGFIVGEFLLGWWFFAFRFVPLAVLHSPLILAVPTSVGGLPRRLVSAVLAVASAFIIGVLIFLIWPRTFWTDPMLMPFFVGAAVYGLIGIQSLGLRPVTHADDQQGAGNDSGDLAATHEEKQNKAAASNPT